MRVRKREGNVVDFDENKIEIAIEKAFESVGLGDRGKIKGKCKRLTSLVLGEVEKLGKDIVGVEEIQDIVEDKLFEEGYLYVLKSYIKYRYRRQLSRDNFLKNQSDLMKKIEGIGTKDAISNNDKRENANVNGDTSMGTMLQYGSAVSKEYSKSYLISKEFADAHNKGDIHIHDLDFFSMGTSTCTQLDLNKLFKKGFSTGHGFLREPQSITSYAALAAIVIQSNQNDQHGGQSIPCFDYYMAPGVIKTFKKEFTQLIYDFSDLSGLLESINFRKVSEYIDCLKTIKLSNVEIEEIIKESRVSFKDNQLPKSLVEKAYNKALKMTDRIVYQAMEALIHNLNTMNSRAGSQVPFSSINLGTDISPEGRLVIKNFLLALEAGLGKGETAIFPVTIFKVKEGVNFNKDDKNYDLFRLACRVSAERLYPNFAFIDAPFNIHYYKEGHPETEATYMGCRTRVMANVNGDNVVTGRGNLSFTSINLPRLGIKYGKVSRKNPDLAGFFRELEEKMDLVKGQLLERYKLQCSKKVKNFPFLMGQGVWVGSDGLDLEDNLEDVLKQGTLSIGFIGLAETLKALIGKHHGEDKKAQELGLKIIKFMRDKTDEYTKKYSLNFTLLATPAEGLSGRFIGIDRELYGSIEGITDRDYYTNSFHVPVYFPISVYDKVRIEAPYHNFTNAGHITYVELDGDVVENTDAFEDVVRAMKELGIGYGAINHPVDRCPKCGFTGVIDDKCPRCMITEKEVRFQRTRRITGYLVGDLDKFNDAKRAEERDRVKHSL